MITLGDIALCQNGHLGLITDIKRNGRNGELVYLGVHLAKGRYGSKWQSSSPIVKSNIHKLMKGSNVSVP